MTPSWHFTTWLDAADHWQALLAGALGFGAAILAVVLTLGSERRKADQELEALRRSIGIEVRQSLAAASGTFGLLAKLAQKDDGPITSRMVENCTHFQTPLILPAVADKIGLLGPQAMQVLIFYNVMQTVQRGLARIPGFREPDDIAPVVVAGTANNLVPALEHGCRIIADLKTKDPITDERDPVLVSQIAGQISQWMNIREARWPDLK